MDIRGVKIHVLQDISKRLNDFNSAERVFCKGNSAIKLADNILQIRKLNSNKQIVRENITLNEQEQLLIKPINLILSMPNPFFVEIFFIDLS